ncbi:MAG: hypothetical protein WDM92_09170 [Caulobacteraceae bacterium]
MLDGVGKRFGDFAAVDDLSFTARGRPHPGLPRPQRRRQRPPPCAWCSA